MSIITSRIAYNVDNFGEQAVETAKLIFLWDAKHDQRMWDLMCDDVTFIGPLPDQYANGKEEYKESIKEDFDFWFDLYDEHYILEYYDDEVALVSGSYLVKFRETEPVFFMHRQRFSMLFINVDGAPLLKHIHLSHPDNLIQEGETYPYMFGQDLRKMIDDMKRSATNDAMTGLYNRNFFEANYHGLNNMISTPPYGYVLYFDLNGLKAVNDKEGHEKGDRLIINFAQSLKTAALEVVVQSVTLRTGGDEFLVIAPHATLEQVGALLRKVKQEFKQRCAMLSPFASFAMGFVHLKEGMELKDAVSLADERMFRCKRYIRGQR